jgi:hypothetical protein
MRAVQYPAAGLSVGILTRTMVLAPLLAAVTAGCFSFSTGGSSAGLSQGPRQPPTTQEELKKAIDIFGRCLSDSRIELVNSGWDPVNQQRFILSFPAPGMPDDELTRAVDTCRSKHLDAVEARYATSHPPEMAPELLKSTRACLAGRGVKAPIGIRSPYELLQSLPADKQRDLADCVLENMQRLYPSLPVYSFP